MQQWFDHSDTVEIADSVGIFVCTFILLFSITIFLSIW